MLAALFLLVTSLAGVAVVTRAVPTAPAIVRVPAGFLLALVVTSGLTYLIASNLAGQTTHALRIGLIASVVLGAGVLVALRGTLRPRIFAMPRIDAAVGAGSLLFSWWLLRAHLRYENGELVVSANTWSDTALHVALARSFSVGANYPTEYPFFANAPIRYHFGFDFYAGMLQEGGASVLWSFNLPAIIGFTAMMLITFATARLLFSPAEPTAARRDRGIWIGLVAIALLLTNQSLAWLRYVQEDAGGNLLTALKPSLWWKHEGYLASGPYDGDRIAIFNSLNPYLGQAHLIIAIAFVLALTYLLLAQLRDHDGDAQPLSLRLFAGLGVAFGASFWINGVVWLAAGVFFAALLGLWALAACRQAARAADPGQRRTAMRQLALSWLKLGAAFGVPALLLAVPQALALSGGSSEGGLSIHIGYLVCQAVEASCHENEQMNLLSPSDWWSFLEFWWLNAGVATGLLLVAFVLGNARDRKIIGAVTAIFVWGNLFTVGLDLGGHNHKTFNLWETLNGVYVAFAVVELWLIAGRQLRAGRRALGIAARVLIVGLCWLLIASGIIDFMTVKNDTTPSVFGDAVTRQSNDWIVANTPPRATFLTDYDQIYTEPTMAGRAVLLGYSPWAQTSGYDVEPRKQAVAAIYAAPDRDTACRLLAEQQVDYVIVGPHERMSDRFKLNEAVFAQFTPAASFGADAGRISIYQVAAPAPAGCGAPSAAAPAPAPAPTPPIAPAPAPAP